MSLRNIFARLCVVALIASQATVILGATSASAINTDNRPMTLTVNTAAPTTGCTGTTGTTVTLPLNGSVNATVNWGDGTATQTYTNADPSYTYGSSGIYTISVTGSATGFGRTQGFCQLTGVTNWGTTTTGTIGLTGLTSLANAFYIDPNFITVPTDFPPAVTDASAMFAADSAFNQNVSTWNTAAVTDMSFMFYGDTAFNNGGVALATTPGGWNTAAVTNMAAMFNNDVVFNQNVSSWNTATVTNMDHMFNGASAFNNGGVALATTAGGWNTAVVTTTNSMFYGDTAFNQNVSTWNTAAVTNMSYMFHGDSAFNNGGASLATTSGGWNTAGVTNTSYMFQGDSAFNQNISSWNTAGVKNTSYMFQGDSAFNNGGASLATTSGGWNTAGVTNTSYMFQGDSAFNQNISSWNTAGVKNTSYMFQGDSAFNNGGASLATTSGGWNTAGVTNMDSMFDSDSAFNQNVSSWNTAAVTNMPFMFHNATAFNNGGALLATTPGGWDTAAVTNMSGMFYGDTAFNQSVSSWDTAAVTNMYAMFDSATAFNQNISTWNTVAVTNMPFMFAGATAFNNGGVALITTAGGWNTAAVTNMYEMYYHAAAFDQSLGTWVVVNVTDMTYMLSGTVLSVSNYDATLVGWAGQTVKSSVLLGANGLVYDSSGATARSTLTSSTDSWNITGDSLTNAATDTVTFNAEGGSSVANMSGPDATKITLPSDTYAGHTFDGWFAAATGGAALTSPYTLAGSVTLYAQWTTNATDTITFSSDGGSSVANMSGPDGTAITLPSDTYAGHTFDGWFAAATGGAALTSPYTLAGSVTLYAQWTANATVTPRAPTNAAPPTGLPLSSFGAPTSLGASCTVPTTLTQSAGNESATVTAPAGALPCPTTVSVYPITDTTAVVTLVPPSQSYVVSLAVSWQTSNGSSPASTSPLTMVLTDARIEAGDTIYELTSTGLKAVGTASANGTATITFTNDPTFVIAHTNPVAQIPLTLTSITSTVGKAITLTTSGGSGNGVVSYTVTNGTASGCVVSGSSLHATKAGTCIVTATKAVDTTYNAVSSIATTVTFRGALRDIKMTSAVWTGKSVVTNLLGVGFYGTPRVTSNVRGTRVGVLHDDGHRLTIRVTVAKNTPRGVHVFTIVFAHGERITVRYNQR